MLRDRYIGRRKANGVPNAVRTRRSRCKIHWRKEVALRRKKSVPLGAMRELVRVCSNFSDYDECKLSARNDIDVQW